MPWITSPGCQAWGGARAEKEMCGGAANTNSTLVPSRSWLETSGNGRAGAADGTAAPASCITVQIAHGSWARPLGACFVGAAGASADGADGCVVQAASNVDFVAPKPATCTCPNDNVSWSANANSAHQAPNRAFARNQRMAGVYSLTLGRRDRLNRYATVKLTIAVPRHCSGRATVAQNCDVEFF